ncbi:hypothetical protein [Psychrobacter glacincola]|uniref:Uncharacterized protein n=1 Tax=Psychrobacter glacincola TaxID=56810 RepID=A0ABW1WC78_9GAMM|nr:hypothetical protein [Psychrobacter glacincola]
MTQSSVTPNVQDCVNSSIDNKASDYRDSSDKERVNNNPYRAYSFDKDNVDNECSNDKPFSLDDILKPIPPHKAIADIDNRFELAVRQTRI